MYYIINTHTNDCQLSSITCIIALLIYHVKYAQIIDVSQVIPGNTEHKFPTELRVCDLYSVEKLAA